MITLNNIVKQYNKKVVLNDINLTIHTGQSIAFTGHNGCGKSTLLKVIAKLVRPTAGEICYERPLLFHYVPEHFPKMNLTAEEYLLCQGKMDGLSEEEVVGRVKELSEDFFLNQMLDTPMKHLSKGSLQKVGVIQALLKEPEVLILDEPLSGQDVMSQQVFIRKINELRKKQVTILMSCHEPYLVDAISDVIYHFDHGHLTEITDRSGLKTNWYTLFFEKQENAVVPEKWRGHLQFIENGCNLRVSEESCNEAILEMIQAGWNLRRMWKEGEE